MPTDSHFFRQFGGTDVLERTRIMLMLVNRQCKHQAFPIPRKQVSGFRRSPDNTIRKRRGTKPFFRH